ncbi:MAG TPA: lycopene cyclase domain-containing protein [Polyangiaceae bacterium]
MRYNFLILCVLFAMPPLFIYGLRADLRRPMAVTALFALPFGLTEAWFYPEYWRPHFLFDLADRIGFGIEDLLFVAALGAFTATVYPFVARRRFVALDTLAAPLRLRRPLVVMASALTIVLVLRALGIPAIYGACAAMIGVTAVMLALRRDLIRPCLVGGCWTLLVYVALCQLFQWLLPGVFELAWNTKLLSNRYILGVPLEELLYGFCAGFSGAAVYPFFCNQRLEPLS